MDSRHFSALDAFLALVDAGGFGRAARTLGVTQSTISRRIALLEQRLGVKLVARTTRSFSLTDAGQVYSADARRALSTLAEAERAVGVTDGKVAGLVRLTAPSAFGRARVIPLLTSLAGEHPDLRFDLDLSDRYVDLQAGGLDLAIRLADDAPSGWSSERISQTSGKLVATEAHLQRHGWPENPSQLVEHPTIAVRTYQPRTCWTFKLKDTVKRIEVEPTFIVSDFSAAFDLAQAGAGITAVPDYLADGAITRGDIVELLPGALADGATIYALMPSQARGLRRVQVVRDALLKF